MTLTGIMTLCKHRLPQVCASSFHDFAFLSIDKLSTNSTCCLMRKLICRLCDFPPPYLAGKEVKVEKPEGGEAVAPGKISRR